MQAILDALAAAFDPAVYAERLAARLPGLVVAGFTLLAFYLVWRAARRGLEALTRHATVDRTAAAFMEGLLRYALLIVAALTALGQLGVNTGSILASLGVVGLTVGFAARDTLSNLISGLFIFWDRPFVLGDLVEIGDAYGRVERITMRSTRLVTPDGRMIAIPNSVVINSTVASYTNFPHLRLEIDFTVGTGEDLGRVRRLLLDKVAGDPALLRAPAPDVVVTALNDYNVAMRLRVWLDDEKAHLASRFSLREQVFLTLREAGVDMPVETLAVRTSESPPAR